MLPDFERPPPRVRTVHRGDREGSGARTHDLPPPGEDLTPSPTEPGVSARAASNPSYRRLRKYSAASARICPVTGQRYVRLHPAELLLGHVERLVRVGQDVEPPFAHRVNDDIRDSRRIERGLEGLGDGGPGRLHEPARRGRRDGCRAVAVAFEDAGPGEPGDQHGDADSPASGRGEFEEEVLGQAEDAELR